MNVSLSLDESCLRILGITHIPTFRSESTVTTEHLIMRVVRRLKWSIKLLLKCTCL